MSRRERVTINRHSTWNGLYDSFGLSRKVVPETNPCSRHITMVELSKVHLVPCRDRRGRLVRGIDMVHRYAEFSDARSHVRIRLFRSMPPSSTIAMVEPRSSTISWQSRATHIRTFSSTGHLFRIRRGKIHLSLKFTADTGASTQELLRRQRGSVVRATSPSHWADDTTVKKQYEAPGGRLSLWEIFGTMIFRMAHIPQPNTDREIGSGELGEKCAVFGVYGKGLDVARLSFFGLYALQHRGQESAGIAAGGGG